ncbi:lipoxygenase 2 [Euphorbia peplus]|nr:lipoxygenase 2 [Euphorbia peplus]
MDISLSVKAIVTVKATSTDFLTSILTAPLDCLTDLFARSFLLHLLSSDLDTSTNEEKDAIKGYAHKVWQKDGEAKYEAVFIIPQGFGQVGAISVENEHFKEIYVLNIVLQGFSNGPINFNCESWVHSKHDNPKNRIFFSNKSYLPEETPSGLKRLRKKELEILRGDGKGERKKSDRIYDYDTYNDLGDPDSDIDLKRPVLGGNQFPYPRRCRTGRPPSKTDPLSESRSGYIYGPRDEEFSDIKGDSFTKKTIRAVLNSLVPQLSIRMIDKTLGFPHFTEIDLLFKQAIILPKGTKVGILPRLLKSATIDDGNDLFSFETPDLMQRDKFSWFQDEEFSRQTLAGLNPFSIELVREWPIKSKLDPSIYGTPESLLSKELIEYEICGTMTLDEAFEEKRLFLLDYHDLFMPYVAKVRALEGTTLYGSRTLFFLTKKGTLKPVAIELTRPPIGDKPQWRHVFTPGCDATNFWLWRIAKAHVIAHDSGYHQLIIHWLRTHCCTEPYIIAANRQLSAMHPIYRLLQPHFRYTMEINSIARDKLINADGIIESSFSPGKYSMELSSVAYHKLWRFDMESLPGDLIRRGMAIEDPTAPHGLKLAIEDYPFANDALILWDAIKQWVSDYVFHYYPDAINVELDEELQAFWTEVRTKGHADKKDEPWWPILKTQDNVIQTLSTIIWVSTGHHAAVNFGQYLYGGYFPNRPTIARTNVPIEDPISDEDFQFFLNKPEVTLLRCFPSQVQATQVMAVLDVLSTHSPDEEYLGEKSEPSWDEDPKIKAVFEMFQTRLEELEGIIDQRNGDTNLRNRSGAGVVPYELLKPSSKQGKTKRGVPTSISI